MSHNSSKSLYALRIFIIIAVLAVICFTAVKLIRRNSGSVPASDAAAPEAGADKLRPDLGEDSIKVDGVTYIRKKHVESYLLLGIDQTQEQVDSGAAGQADLILLLVLDRDTDTYRFIHINRDTMTLVFSVTPGGNVTGEQFAQICLSHSHAPGGALSCENVVRSVRYLLSDIEPDGYIAFNLGSIGILNDAVGGVTLKITEDLTSVDPSFVKGASVTLSADTAEKFVRARMNLGEADNTGRMARQKAYMNAWIGKAKARASGSGRFIMDLLDDLQSVLVTDLSEKRLTSVANDTVKYSNEGFVYMDGENRAGLLFNEFYPDSESLQKLILETFYEVK